MNKRDTSALRLEFPDADYDNAGSVQVSSGFFACIFSGLTWSGISKNKRKETCTGDDDILDGFGNLIEQIKTGKIISYGNLTVTVDWDPGENDKGGKIYSAFANSLDLEFNIAYPVLDATESAGPKIVIEGVITDFKPMTNILSEDDEARSAAEFIIEISKFTVVEPVAV